MRAAIERAMHAAWRKNGLLSKALWPLSRVYAAIVAGRKATYLRRPERVHHETIPVVVVGNIYIGGTGKTPVTIALVRALRQLGWQPGVVSRGYGGRPGDKPLVGSGALEPSLFGDEPALIAAQTGAPVAVHPDRGAAVRRLRRQYPKVDVIVSDDGLQHLALGRDLEIIVQDARGIGNGKLLPAGPLREPAGRLLSADFIVNNLLPGEPAPEILAGPAHRVDMTLAPAVVEHLDSGEHFEWSDWLSRHRGRRCAAVAAIGRPERFFAMLRHHGLEPMRERSLPDHYDYRESPFRELDAECILITPKDAVKCRRFGDPRLYCVHPAPHFSDSGWLELVNELLKAISERKRTTEHAQPLNS